MSKPNEQKIAEVIDALEGKHREWVETFAAEHDCDYEQVMRAAQNWLDTGEYEHIGVDINYEAAGGEFWDHFQALKGLEVPADKRGNFFNCSC
jgi:hypothetical protein